MKRNSYFVKGMLVLGLVGSVAMAGDLETNDDNGQDVIIKSSIQMPNSETETMEKQDTKIGAGYVATIVKANFNGKITGIKLEDIDGNLVYKAEVFSNNKTTDVYVDAGNGKILTSNIDKNDNQYEENGDENENDNGNDNGNDN